MEKLKEDCFRAVGAYRYISVDFQSLDFICFRLAKVFTRGGIKFSASQIIVVEKTLTF